MLHVSSRGVHSFELCLHCAVPALVLPFRLPAPTLDVDYITGRFHLTEAKGRVDGTELYYIISTTKEQLDHTKRPDKERMEELCEDHDMPEILMDNIGLYPTKRTQTCIHDSASLPFPDHINEMSFYTDRDTIITAVAVNTRGSHRSPSFATTKSFRYARCATPEVRPAGRLLATVKDRNAFQLWSGELEYQVVETGVKLNYCVSCDMCSTCFAARGLGAQRQAEIVSIWAEMMSARHHLSEVVSALSEAATKRDNTPSDGRGDHDDEARSAVLRDSITRLARVDGTVQSWLDGSSVEIRPEKSYGPWRYIGPLAGSSPAVRVAGLNMDERKFTLTRDPDELKGRLETAALQARTRGQGANQPAPARAPVGSPGELIPTKPDIEPACAHGKVFALEAKGKVGEWRAFDQEVINTKFPGSTFISIFATKGANNQKTLNSYTVTYRYVQQTASKPEISWSLIPDSRFFKLFNRPPQFHETPYEFFIDTTLASKENLTPGCGFVDKLGASATEGDGSGTAFVIRRDAPEYALAVSKARPTSKQAVCQGQTPQPPAWSFAQQIVYVCFKCAADIGGFNNVFKLAKRFQRLAWQEGPTGPIDAPAENDGGGDDDSAALPENLHTASFATTGGTVDARAWLLATAKVHSSEGYAAYTEGDWDCVYDPDPAAPAGTLAYIANEHVADNGAADVHEEESTGFGFPDDPPKRKRYITEFYSAPTQISFVEAVLGYMSAKDLAPLGLQHHEMGKIHFNPKRTQRHLGKGERFRDAFALRFRGQEPKVTEDVFVVDLEGFLLYRQDQQMFAGITGQIAELDVVYDEYALGPSAPHIEDFVQQRRPRRAQSAGGASGSAAGRHSALESLSALGQTATCVHSDRDTPVPPDHFDEKNKAMTEERDFLDNMIAFRHARGKAKRAALPGDAANPVAAGVGFKPRKLAAYTFSEEFAREFVPGDMLEKKRSAFDLRRLLEDAGFIRPAKTEWLKNHSTQHNRDHATLAFDNHVANHADVEAGVSALEVLRAWRDAIQARATAVSAGDPFYLTDDDFDTAARNQRARIQKVLYTVRRQDKTGGTSEVCPSTLPENVCTTYSSRTYSRGGLEPTDFRDVTECECANIASDNPMLSHCDTCEAQQGPCGDRNRHLPLADAIAACIDCHYHKGLAKAISTQALGKKAPACACDAGGAGPGVPSHGTVAAVKACKVCQPDTGPRGVCDTHQVLLDIATCQNGCQEKVRTPGGWTRALCAEHQHKTNTNFAVSERVGQETRMRTFLHSSEVGRTPWVMQHKAGIYTVIAVNYVRGMCPSVSASKVYTVLASQTSKEKAVADARSKMEVEVKEAGAFGVERVVVAGDDVAQFAQLGLPQSEMILAEKTRQDWEVRVAWMMGSSGAR